jgi:hypothetical protein
MNDIEREIRDMLKDDDCGANTPEGHMWDLIRIIDAERARADEWKAAWWQASEALGALTKDKG